VVTTGAPPPADPSTSVTLAGTIPGVPSGSTTTSRSSPRPRRNETAWLRAWRSEGLAGLRPCPRADAGTVRAHPELFSEAAALRLELPSRSAARIASILYHRHGIRVAERTVRARLRRAGLHREALAAEPKVFGSVCGRTP